MNNIELPEAVQLRDRSIAGRLMNVAGIYELVRGVLKCGCPDEVFGNVVIGYPSVLGGSWPSSALQVLVGRRLLICLIPANAVASDPKAARQLLVEGKRVRDENGLNRFRLVLIGSVDNDLSEDLNRFATNQDDRMHVHQLAVRDVETP